MSMAFTQGLGMGASMGMGLGMGLGGDQFASSLGQMVKPGTAMTESTLQNLRESYMHFPALTELATQQVLKPRKFFFNL